MLNEMTIGQLAREANLNPRTLRYYEAIGLLIPSFRTPSGYRIYTKGDAKRLSFIRRAQRLGLSLSEIADIIALREEGAAPCHHVRVVADARIAEIDARIAEMCHLREELARLVITASEVEPTCVEESSICLAFELDPSRLP